MGLLKSIGRFYKKVFRGVKKIFKKPLERIGKLLSSKIGKALMIVAAVFTMGTALAAGAAAWQTAAIAGKGLLGKFVAAGGAFIRSMIGIQSGGVETAAKAGAGATEQVAGTLAQAGAGQAQLAESVAGAVAPTTQVVEAATGGPGGLGGLITGAKETIADTAGGLLTRAKDAGSKLFGGAPAGVPGQQVSTGLPAGSKIATGGLQTGGGLFSPPAGAASTGGAGGMLRTAGSKAFEYATSPGGGFLIGSMLQGYAQGRSAEEFQKRETRERRRVDALWTNYRWQDQDFEIGLGPGWEQRILRVEGDRARQPRVSIAGVSGGGV